MQQNRRYKKKKRDKQKIIPSLYPQCNLMFALEELSNGFATNHKKLTSTLSVNSYDPYEKIKSKQKLSKLPQNI